MPRATRGCVRCMTRCPPPPPTDLEGTYAARCKPPLDMSEAEAGAGAGAGAGADACPAPLIQGFHVDVHGKADRAGEADLDVGGRPASELWRRDRQGCGRGGRGAAGSPRARGRRRRCWRRRCWRRRCGRRRCGRRRCWRRRWAATQQATASRCRAASTMSVDARPRLQGWRSVPRWTLTQSSVRLGFVSVQLEMATASPSRCARSHPLRAPCRCLCGVRARMPGGGRGLPRVAARMLIQSDPFITCSFIRRSERPSFIVSVIVDDVRLSKMPRS